MADQPSVAKQLYGDFAPALVDYTDRIVFGEVWANPALSPRDRSLATVAALISGGNTEQLEFHLPHALHNGLTEAELIEVITHLAFYTGWPRAMSALAVAKRLFTGAGE